MTTRSWTVPLLVALIGSAIGAGPAHAGVIRPVQTGVTSPTLYPLDPSPSAPTISILDQSGADITDTWLPDWDPARGGAPGGPVPTDFSVYVVVKSGGVPVVPSSISLVAPPLAIAFDGVTNPFLNALALTTTAYPGQCTNFGSPTDLTPDFDFDTTGATMPGTATTGFLLTPRDCGGMAVLHVELGGTQYTFILPQDSNGNGIPDIWEATFCPASSPCPTGREDADTSAGNPAQGDGIAALDEYRGFIVSGAHVRTDPRQKDVFVHLVNAQCGTDSLLGGGTKTYVTGDALFANVNTFGARLHLIGYTPNASNSTTNEWVDRFVSYTDASGFTFDSATPAIPPPDDRQINRNAVYLGAVQKGLRVTECVDAGPTTTLGFASVGSPNGGDNAIVYTRRILLYFDNTLGAATGALSYSTYQNGGWTTPQAIAHDDLIGKAIAFYVAMEVGHSLNLTPTQEGTNRVPTAYGYHHAPGTGANLDQSIVNKVSNKTGNTFYIPLLYNTSDLTNFDVK